MDEASALKPPVAEPDLESRFCTFVASHRQRALRLAWRLVGGDDAAAEDVAQEAFVKAYGALPRFREDASLATWFYRILIRQAHNYQRWRMVRERWQRLWPRRLDGVSQEASDPFLRQRIAAALERLSRSQKETFVLIYLEGLSIREAARLLGKAEGTVKSHLHRALHTLRDELADLHASTAGVEL